MSGLPGASVKLPPWPSPARETLMDRHRIIGDMGIAIIQGTFRGLIIGCGIGAIAAASATIVLLLSR
jgi:uncharacterized membrane protein